MDCAIPMEKETLSSPVFTSQELLAQLALQFGGLPMPRGGDVHTRTLHYLADLCLSPANPRREGCHPRDAGVTNRVPLEEGAGEREGGVRMGV